MHRVARYGGGRCELWLTPCIVTVPPTGSAVLCVPSNERLCGTAFPHFPVGGPTPRGVIGRFRAVLTHHACVLLEWEHGLFMSVIELAWLNGLGGYGGKCQWYHDMDSPAPAV